MTSHNRKADTLAALAALFKQRSSAQLTVYCVDDGSTDGTPAAITAAFPQVKVLNGTGSLFWNGGMRLAYTAALSGDDDYHLWLNDDTILRPDAIQHLLDTLASVSDSGSAIISGATRDPQSGQLTSGGFRCRWPRWLMRFTLAPPQAVPQRCDTVSGNCVLVPRTVYQSLGNFSAHYRHFLGDIDYGLRARREGYDIWLAGGYVGTSPVHHGRGNELAVMPTGSALWQQLQHPKGLSVGADWQQRFMPMPEWTTFLKTHSGWLWWLPWLLTYQKLVGLLIFRWRYNKRSR